MRFVLFLAMPLFIKKKIQGGLGFFFKYRQTVQKMLGNSHYCICSFILLLNDTSWVLMMLLIVESDAHFYTQASGREQF